MLVNNAGLALGRESLEQSSDTDWVQMLETNVLGVARMTRAVLPLLRVPPHAHIVNIGSTAGFEAYAGGGYPPSKHALRAITGMLRLELNAEPIRVTEVAPGMVETAPRYTPASRRYRRPTSRNALGSPSPGRPTSASTMSSSIRSPRRRQTRLPGPHSRLTIPHWRGPSRAPGPHSGLRHTALARAFKVARTS